MAPKNEIPLGKIEQTLTDRVTALFAHAGEKKEYAPVFQGTLGQKLVGYALYLSLISGIFAGAHALGKTEAKEEEIKEETLAKTSELKPLDLQKLIANFYVPETAPKNSERNRAYLDQRFNRRDPATLRNQEKKPVYHPTPRAKTKSGTYAPQSHTLDLKENHFFLNLGTTPNLPNLLPRSQMYHDDYTNPEKRAHADMENRLKNTKRYDALIRKASDTYGIPVNLLYGLIMIESAGSNNAGSSAGAKGLMQLMPGTAREQKCPNRMNPAENIPCGVKYLARTYRNFHKKLPNWNEQDVWALTLRGYNQGPNGAWKYLKAAEKKKGSSVGNFDEFVKLRNGEDGSYDYAYQILAIQRMLDERDGFRDYAFRDQRN